MSIALFQTPRLTPRQLRASDLEAFHAFQSDPDVMRYIKAPLDWAGSQRELKQFMDFYEDTTRFFKIWGLTLCDSDTLIGLCGVYQNEQQEYEIAYRFHRDYWGQGLGREVAQHLIQYCFEALNLELLTAYVEVDNAGSIQILERHFTWVRSLLPTCTAPAERVYQLPSSQWFFSS